MSSNTIGLLIVIAAGFLAFRLNPKNFEEAIGKPFAYFIAAGIILAIGIFGLPKLIAESGDPAQEQWAPIISGIDFGWSSSNNSPAPEDVVEPEAETAVIIATPTIDPYAGGYAPEAVPMETAVPETTPDPETTSTPLPPPTAVPTVDATAVYQRSLANQTFATVAEYKKIGDRGTAQLALSTLVEAAPAAVNDTRYIETIAEIEASNFSQTERVDALSLARSMDNNHAVMVQLSGYEWEVLETGYRCSVWTSPASCLRTVWQQTAVIKIVSDGWLRGTTYEIKRGFLSNMGVDQVGTRFSVVDNEVTSIEKVGQ